jgi:predicted O-linked N-acetylglucosamine transferase (SPINDLY family)
VVANESNLDAILNAQAQAASNLLQHGRVQQAEAICVQILARRSDHFHGLHLLGIAALQKSDAAGAISWLSAAVASDPRQAAAWSNLAAAFLAAGVPSRALAAGDRAVSLMPCSPDAVLNRAHALGALGRTEEALVGYRQASSLAPGHAGAIAGAANALLTLGRVEEALAEFERALEREPASAALSVDFARALLVAHRPEAALDALTSALRIDPSSAPALSVRGSALRQLRRPSEALSSYQDSLRLQPEQPDVHSNVANLALQTGHLEEAVASCERALALQSSHLQALNIRAHALRGLGRFQEAAASFDRLLEVAPQFDYARGNRLHARAAVCDWTDYATEVEFLHSAVLEGRRVCQPLSFLSFVDDPEAQYACARMTVADRHPALPRRDSSARSRSSRIRVAYISADFRNHPVAHLLVGVLESHDRHRFEIHALSTEYEPREVAIRSRIKAAVDNYEDVSERSDLEVAARLEALGIDIAVDLNGHSLHGRLGIFASHPAPVQVSFLGYTGTSGADYIDYLLADGTALPPELEPAFAERIVRLPCSFLPNDDRQPISSATPLRAALGLPEAGFVFCAFNNPHKIAPQVFDVWMGLLRRTSGSILWLQSGHASLLGNLRDEARRRNVDPARLVFAERLPSMDEHLARYRCADLFLDTYPYGAHATSRDALWAGLPVLTRAGRSFSSRVAASLLTELQLPELIATSLDDYAARGLELAASPAALRALRDRLNAQRLRGPVFSTSRYCRALELAFETMWGRCLSGVAPSPLTIPATSAASRP